MIRRLAHLRSVQMMMYLNPGGCGSPGLTVQRHSHGLIPGVDINKRHSDKKKVYTNFLKYLTSHS